MPSQPYYKEDELAEIIHKYGEERWSKRIAQFIVAARKERLGNIAGVSLSGTSDTVASKEQYLKNKQELAAERKKARHIERLQKEMAELEAELDEVDALMCGEAATDYRRVAELDARKSEIEERLLEIYAELE